MYLVRVRVRGRVRARVRARVSLEDLGEGIAHVCDVRAVLDEQDHRVQMAALGSEHQGCAAVGPHLVHRRPSEEQALQQSHVASQCCAQETR